MIEQIKKDKAEIIAFYIKKIKEAGYPKDTYTFEGEGYTLCIDLGFGEVSQLLAYNERNVRFDLPQDLVDEICNELDKYT